MPELAKKKSPSRFPTIFVIVLVILVLILAYFLFFGRHHRPSQTALFVVQRGTIQQTVQAPGTVAQPGTLNLTFPSSQATPTLTALNVQPGERVTAGQVLAQEDASNLQQTVAQDQATLASTQNSLQILNTGPTPQQLASYQATLESAQVAWTTAQATYQDNLVIDQQTLISDQNLLGQALAVAAYSNGQPVMTGTLATDQTKVSSDKAAFDSLANTLAAAKAAYDQAQASYNLSTAPPSPTSVAAGQDAVTNAQFALARDQLSLAKTTLTAPFAGTIGAVNYTVGAVVSSATPVLTIVPSQGALQITAQISEGNISQVQVGQPVIFSPDSNPAETFQGTVSAVATAPIVTSSVTQYQVTISFAISNVQKLVPGMTGTVTITVASAQNVLFVPTTALVTGTQPAVYAVIGSGKGVSYQQIPVSTGLYNTNYIQITKGLQAGEQILAYGYLPTLQNNTGNPQNSSGGGNGPGSPNMMRLRGAFGG